MGRPIAKTIELNMHHIQSAYILAGGQSSRFGKNKATIPIDGTPLVVRLTQQLKASGVEHVVLVAQSVRDYESFGIRTIEDGHANAGPLAGIISALRDARDKDQTWCLIASCDILEWRSEWTNLFKATAKLNSQAKVITMEGEAFRPFPGLYHTDLLPTAEVVWESGVRSVRGLHQALGENICRCEVPASAMPKAFNTPEELAFLLEKNA